MEALYKKLCGLRDNHYQQQKGDKQDTWRQPPWTNDIIFCFKHCPLSWQPCNSCTFACVGTTMMASHTYGLPYPKSTSQHFNRYMYYPPWLHIVFFPKQSLHCSILGLHVTTRYWKDLTIFYIAHITMNPCPIFRCFTRSNVTHGILMSTLTYICFTSFTPLLGKSINNMKTKTLFFDWPKKRFAVDKVEPFVIFERHVILHGTNPLLYTSFWPRHGKYMGCRVLVPVSLFINSHQFDRI